MRILYFGNNYLGLRILSWLKAQGEEIVGLVIHPQEKRKYGKEIIACSQLDQTRVLDGSKLRQTEMLRSIQSLRPELGVSVLFGYILAPEFLSLLPRGCINLHPAFLPYNRGAYPNVWSIVEGTPAGVTLHYIDSGIDTGDIIARKPIAVEPTDTGESLYRKSEHASIDLFTEIWPLVRTGRAPRTPLPRHNGTFHRLLDVDQIDEIDLNRSYTARELINVIRARTFPPYPGAYFRDGSRRIYLRLQLLDEQDVSNEGEGNRS